MVIPLITPESNSKEELNVKTTFNPTQFIPTQFNTSEDKAKFANQFVRFVQSDFKKSLFPEWFYRRLSDSFGHIDHGNQNGFYETFFTAPKGKVDFIRICQWGGGYVDSVRDYSDVEKALKQWLIDHAVLEKVERRFEEAVEEIERAWAAAAKYRNHAAR